MIIVKRGTNASCFALPGGITIKLEPQPVLNVIEDDVFEKLMQVYGSFIKPRICSDKNPNGCFIIKGKKEDANAMDKEMGVLKDGSAPIDANALDKKQSKQSKKK